MSTIIIPPPMTNERESARNKLTKSIRDYEAEFGVSFVPSDEAWVNVSEVEEACFEYSDPTDIARTKDSGLDDGEIEVTFDEEFATEDLIRSLSDDMTSAPPPAGFVGNNNPTMPTPYSRDGIGFTPIKMDIVE